MDLWLLQNGLLVPNKRGKRARECVWNTDSLCGTVMYAAKEIVRSGLFTATNWDSPQYVKMCATETNIVGCIACLRGSIKSQDDEHIVSYLRLMESEIRWFQEASLDAFEVVDTKSADYAICLSTFQEHQNTISCAIGYIHELEGIRTTRSRPMSNERVCELACYGWLSTQGQCTHRDFKLIALLGNIQYAAYRLESSLDGLLGDSPEPLVLGRMRLACMELDKSICSCDVVSSLEDTTISCHDIPILQNLLECVVEVHRRSLCLLPTMIHCAGYGQRHTWEPTFQSYQMLLQSASRRLTEILG
jgi:hypothetical protein